jgi:hypothetical protein
VIRVTVALLGVFAVLAPSAFGDGFPVLHGRYQGKTTVLHITGAQVKALEGSREMTLTRRQKGTLRAEVGIAPSRLHVYFAKDGENDHRCMAYNVAMRFSERHLEVPH